MLKSKKIIVALTIAASMMPSSALAKATPSNEQNKAPNNIMENQKQDNKEHKKEKSEEKEEKTSNRLEERDNLVEKADKIVPGVKAEWDKVSKERKELLNQLKPLKKKHIEENKLENKEENKKENKENKLENNEEGKGKRENLKEKHKETREEKKAMWEEFEKAVDSNDAEKVKSSFKKIINSMEKSNDRLKLKIKKLS